MVRSLAALKVDHAQWIGVNLDPAASQDSARQLVVAGNFPGLQIYSDPSVKDGIAARLGFDVPPLAFFVGGDGTIAYLYGADDLLRNLPYFGL